MKIVRDFKQQDDAVNFAFKLRERGIPTHVGVFKSNNSHFYTGGGPRTYGVWVLDEKQHHDAVLLIKGGRHKVENPLSEEQMVHLERELSRKNIRIVVRDLILFSLGLGTLIVLLVGLWHSNA
ncbi:hypothetical protein [Microbulbifer sp. RZ01]|uniref:hypothetical protein n=1 Tax=Microbulbifer sp. RZ01 TaxID=3021711 RepID=UPI0027E3DAD4|nr:hypothetical protein [Microbulbifer sp. RZ01]